MKLINLKIEKLYGVYDYNVDFNTDVTFIYGENGCGKTTILNITEAIITGQLFKLFNYTFKMIKLTYSENCDDPDTKSIEIHKKSKDNEDNEDNEDEDEDDDEDDDEIICIVFNKKLFKIKNMSMSFRGRRFERYPEKLSEFYLNKFPSLDDIKKTFNYIYLPLNRSISIENEDENEDNSRNPYMYRSKYSNSVNVSKNNNSKKFNIISLIKTHFQETNTCILRINDEFRNEILKHFLALDKRPPFKTILKDILKLKNYDIEFKKTEKDYLKILHDLNLLNKVEEEENYKSFFTKLIEGAKKFKSNTVELNLGNFEESIGFVLDYQDYDKIKKLILASEKMQKDKKEAVKHIVLFLNTMNEFIENNEDGKTINIDETGKINFTTKYNKSPIDIQHLSSGEKQLITFFTNLIFMENKDKPGIFVVDEPELSLHLSWQALFVEKALQINSNIQFIFATHSPEIIGVDIDKALKLEKIYTQLPNE